MRDKSTNKKRERRFSLRNVISTLLLIFALGLLFYPIYGIFLSNTGMGTNLMALAIVGDFTSEGCVS